MLGFFFRNHTGVTHRTLVTEVIEIIIELDRPLKRDLGESLSWQPTVLHPWTISSLTSDCVDACYDVGIVVIRV